MTLSTAQLEQFETKGYVFPIDILDEKESTILRQKLEAYEATQGGKLAPNHRAKSHLIFKWLDDLIRDPRILDPIEQLIGPNILCWNTIFWIKDVGSESFVSWHQDTRYWGLSSPNVITAWLALSPASVESGCMRVMPYTHLGEVMPHEDRYHDDNMLTRGQEITEGIDDEKAVFMHLKTGQISFHNYRLAHSSGPNRAPDRRIGISMHFMPTDTEQIVGDWDSAALVRGEDKFGNFTPTPVPTKDFDHDAMAFQARAAQALNKVIYQGAANNSHKI